MNTIKIAFITSSSHPHVSEDDALLFEKLRQYGADIAPVPWDSPSIDWPQYHALIIRSCWNYHLKPGEFKQWLDKLEELQIQTFNSVKTIRWNLHKQYLLELRDRGIKIPPSVLIRQHSSAQLEKIFDEQGWTKAVIKPAISATAYRTWVSTKETMTHDQGKFEESIRFGDIIVQQFINEVTVTGEISLIYFNKQYSHAVLKKAQKGDFRVQNNFGGTVELFKPSQEVIEQGNEILKCLDESLLYARIDGILANGEFVLMELELIEPVLFFQHNKTSAETLAKNLLEELQLKLPS